MRTWRRREWRRRAWQQVAARSRSATRSAWGGCRRRRSAAATATCSDASTPRGRRRRRTRTSSSRAVRSGSTGSMAELLERTVAAVEPVGSTAGIRARLDAKTKPRGSLGRLEDLAVRATAAGARADTWRPVIVVAAADHGVARQGVSAYPQEVTRQMLKTFAAGAAAVCVLARQAGAELVVVDAGVVDPLDDPRVR